MSRSVRRALGNAVSTFFLGFGDDPLTILVGFYLVRVLYDYQSQGSDELDIQEGQVLELTSGPSGGQSYAEGWWEGVSLAGQAAQNSDSKFVT